MDTHAGGSPGNQFEILQVVRLATFRRRIKTQGIKPPVYHPRPEMAAQSRHLVKSGREGGDPRLKQPVGCIHGKIEKDLPEGLFLYAGNSL